MYSKKFPTYSRLADDFAFVFVLGCEILTIHNVADIERGKHMEIMRSPPSTTKYFSSADRIFRDDVALVSNETSRTLLSIQCQTSRLDLGICYVAVLALQAAAMDAVVGDGGNFLNERRCA